MTSRSQGDLPLEVNETYHSTYYQPKYQPYDPSFLSTCDDEIEVMEKDTNITYAAALEQIRAQVEADQLGDIGQELVECMAWVQCTQQCKTILIHGMQVPIDLVRKRFSQLRCEHLQYVLTNVQSCKTKIRNRRSYLITCLYDAPVTYTATKDSEMQIPSVRAVPASKKQCLSAIYL